MLSLTEDQVRQLADVDVVIEALRTAFARDFSQTLEMPVRSSLPLPNQGVLLLMPAHDSFLGVAGIKTVTVTKAGGVNAAYELLDPCRGITLARMEANWLTDLRTAATSAVVTSVLARSDARTLGIFGTGRQAEAHIAVLRHVRKFTRIRVCGSGKSGVQQFCRTMNARYEVQVDAVDAESCVRQSDVVCTCTTSRVPVLDGRWLKPGMHLNLIGGFQPESREVDSETVLCSRVVVDTYEGAWAEAGDLLIPLAEGAIQKNEVMADLHEMLSGKRWVRTGADDITLFKSVGCALEDLVTAKLVYERAMQMTA
jgi:ornithine cyclodeaminase/alanine dehydrogenase-like protein (mu-crystallin family)